jgi:septum site-determining protein MinD
VSKVIVVTSGKGGVGKTTTSASIAAGLAKRGHKTAVIDFDIGLRNLDLIMGCERRVVYDFINVINGDSTLNQALIRDKRLDHLYVLPASQTRDKDALTLDGVGKVLHELQHDVGCEYIVCDSPAGIEKGAFLALYFADEAIVVTNPEVSSVRDSDRILGILAAKSRRAVEGLEPVKEHLLVARYDARRVAAGEMLSLEDIKGILGVPILGVIPESPSVLASSNVGMPIVLDGEDPAALAYKDTVDRYLGADLPLRFLEPEKKGLLKRLFGS